MISFIQVQSFDNLSPLFSKNKKRKKEIIQMKQKQTKAKISRFTSDMNCVDVLAKNKTSAAHKLIEWFNTSVPSRSSFDLSFAEELAFLSKVEGRTSFYLQIKELSCFKELWENVIYNK